MSEPRRISLCCADLGNLPRAAVEYLVLNLNTRQRQVEFEFLPVSATSPLLSPLGPGALISLDQFHRRATELVARVAQDMEHQSAAYRLPKPSLGRMVFVSLATLDGHYYYIYEPEYSAIFLGDWNTKMAPPSILESLLTLIIREGIYALVPNTTAGLTHYATRGCVGDFNASLRDTRYKVLQGFLCSECRGSVEAAVGSEACAAWTALLGKSWIGTVADSTSPATIVKKLGYNLFLTEGFAPTYRERFLQLLQEDGTKEFLKLVSAVLAAVLAAAILLWLKLK